MPTLDIQLLNKQLGFRKLAYLAGTLGLGAAQIAAIVDMPVETVAETLRSGYVPTSLSYLEEATARLYALRVLLSSIYKLGSYQIEQGRALLHEDSTFGECLKPPPWHPDSLAAYLSAKKLTGIENATSWLRQF